MRISIASLVFALFVGWVIGSVACEPKQDGEKTAEKSAEEKSPPKDAGEKTPPGERDTPKDGGGTDDAPKDEASKPEPRPENIVKPEPNPNVGKIRWSTSSTGSIRSLALSPDESAVYAASSSFVAYNAKTGDELWTAASLGAELSPPTVGPDGTIYVGSVDKKFWALSPKSKGVDWNVILTEAAHRYAPALNKDGSVVYLITGNEIRAYKGRGDAAWGANYVVTSGIVSGMSVAGDGTIYVCAKDGALHAIKPDGTKKWEKPLSKEPCKAPAIDADGTIYVGGERLYALSPTDGGIKWSVNTYGTITSSVVINQSFLYFATFKGKLYKANKSDGSPANILWEDGITLTVTGSVEYAPTIGAGGIIYIGTSGNSPALKFLAPADGKGLQNITSSRNDYVGTPAIAKDGTLYIGNSQGTVFAVWTNSPGLANSPWPRATHDNQNACRFK